MKDVFNRPPTPSKASTGSDLSAQSFLDVLLGWLRRLLGPTPMGRELNEACKSIDETVKRFDESLSAKTTRLHNDLETLSEQRARLNQEVQNEKNPQLAVRKLIEGTSHLRERRQMLVDGSHVERKVGDER